MEDVSRIESQWSSSLKGWRRTKRGGDAPPNEDSTEYSGQCTDSAEEDCDCEGSNEEEGVEDEESEGQTDELEDYRDEAFLDQPMEGAEDGDDDSVPFVRHITGLIIHPEILNQTDGYRRVVVGSKCQSFSCFGWNFFVNIFLGKRRSCSHVDHVYPNSNLSKSS